MKRALVTGSAGFLGRHMAALLATRDYDVTGIDVAHCSGCGIEKWLLHDESHYDLVVHCAGYIGGRQEIESEPLLVLRENLRIDTALFDWAAITKPGRIIYISSSAVYPTVLQTPVMAETGYLLGEGAAPDYRPWIGVEPDQTYGFVKLVGERLAQEYRRAGNAITVVRPFSGYGRDQSQDYPFRSIMDRVILADPHDTIDVWSNTVRDFIHVSDVCEGMLAMAEQNVPGPVNLCTGKGTSFVQLVRHFAEVADKPLNVRVLPDMPTGVAHRVGDPKLMLNYFIPRMTLREGVEDALRV